MKTVCIKSQDDGTYLVYEESEGAEGGQDLAAMVNGPQGSPAPESAEPAGETAQNVQQALQIAGRMLQGGQSQQDAAGSMQAGFKRAQPMATPGMMGA